MIKHLKRVPVNNNEDGTQTTRLPNNLEMMNKINEIITEVNRQEQKRFNEMFGTKPKLTR